MIDGRNKSATCARKVLDYFFLIGELKKIVGNYFGGGPHTHVYVLRLSSPRKKIFCFLFSHARVRALSFCKKRNFFLLYFSFLFLSFFFVLWSVRKCVRTSVSAMAENVWFSMRSVCVFLCAELCFFLCPLCVPSEVCGHRVWKVWKNPVARYEATGQWRVICRRTIISQQRPIRHRLWT